MPEKTITVLLVEDDAEVRRRFETTINQDPMMKVVGFASTKHEAQQLIETLDFEVMVIDLGLPDGSESPPSLLRHHGHYGLWR